MHVFVCIIFIMGVMDVVGSLVTTKSMLKNGIVLLCFFASAKVLNLEKMRDN